MVGAEHERSPPQRGMARAPGLWVSRISVEPGAALAGAILIGFRWALCHWEIPEPVLIWLFYRVTAMWATHRKGFCDPADI